MALQYEKNIHLMASFQDNPGSWYQNVFILDFIQAKDVVVKSEAIRREQH